MTDTCIFLFILIYSETKNRYMKVLISGSSGYLGRVLTNDLISRKIPVVGIDILDPPEEIHGEYFNFYNCSITDMKYLQNIFIKEQPTHVLHLACSFNRVRNKKREYKTDIGGSNNILDAANSILTVKQLICFGSASVYGCFKINSTWIDEQHPLLAGNYRYSENKKLIEQSFAESKIREDLNLVILRLCTVTGPSFLNKKSIVLLLNKVPYIPDFIWENKIQLLHEEDLKSVIQLIMNDPEIKGIYNIGPDSFSYIKDLVPHQKHLSIPLIILTAIFWVLWHLRKINIPPSSIKYSAYPIIIDSAKFIGRYRFRYKYSTLRTFEDTVKNHLLLNGSK
jgi:nucleoside-diphosphate-sugar epimerase